MPSKRNPASRRKPPPADPTPVQVEANGGRLNRGGNWGNRYGGGGQAKAVRAKLLRTADRGADYLDGIVKGAKVIVVPGDDFSKDTTRKPKHGERVEAIKIAVAASLPQKVEMVIESGEFFDALVDVLEDLAQEPRVLDHALMDEILVALGERLGGKA